RRPWQRPRDAARKEQRRRRPGDRGMVAGEGFGLTAAPVGDRFVRKSKRSRPRERVLRHTVLSLALAAAAALPAAAQDTGEDRYGGLEQPEVNRPLTPIPPERYEQMVPKHPGYLGALAPENIAKPRPAPPFDLTGTWFVDLREGFAKFLFGPPYPNFYEEGRRALIESARAQA